MNKHRQMMIFKAIVDSGSISKAAERLELSKSVLSNHLKQLENELNIDLLKRTTRRQSLTLAGEQFYRHCVALNDVMSHAWEDIHQLQQQPYGKISVTAPVALMELIVIPALCSAFASYPKVSLNLIADDRQLDLLQNDIDIAIRFGESPDSNIKQKRIGRFQDVLCQSKRACQSAAEANYIANQWQEKDIVHTLNHRGNSLTTELCYTAHHRANNVNQVASLIQNGMGVGLLPDFLLSRYPDLEPCFKEHYLAINNVYALHPYSKSPPASVTHAINAIEKMLKSVTEF
ncbi:LysR family transcriptional regulator [Vibrio hepatarius]|uniref:LysR family transcriptional regulator n=1 Tax=Vibrio hepatarius TaxID=171383 RepID=UPI001C097518|nr:LysR family transcriptional regulator [Vibrio hepatarius]MBU2899301.1 LysR family transcriptional regulator [Vibrio hepatarius]